MTVALDLTLSSDEWLALLYKRALLRFERGEYRSFEEYRALQAFLNRCALETERRAKLAETGVAS